MNFRASLGWSARIITGAITIVFGALVIFNFLLLEKVSGNIAGLGAIFFTMLLPIGIYIVCYLHRPLGYVIGDGKIIIKRPVKSIILNLKNIRDAYLIRKESMNWMWKTFGNGGLFGFYGDFRSDRYGDMTLYATRRGNYLMLETTDREKIVLTPDDVNMVKEIRKLIGKETVHHSHEHSLS